MSQYVVCVERRNIDILNQALYRWEAVLKDSVSQ